MALIGVDTNVVVRLLTRDDPEQFQSAQRCFSEGDVFIADSVLLESAWVLGAVYSFSEARIAAALGGLLGLPNVRVADAERVALALGWYERGLDWADALHLASSQHVEEFKTFDRDFVKQAAGLGSCPVATPAAK